MTAPGEHVYSGGKHYVADHTGTLFRYCKPTGTRLALTVSPGLEQRLARAPKVGRELARVVSEIARLADATVPVDTGALKASQVSDVVLTPNGPVGLVAYLAFYAHFVHNGTVKQAPDPWLTNAGLSVMVQGKAAAA